MVDCILSSSLVYGVFLRNIITILCPGGTFATMCTEIVMHEMKLSKTQKVVIVGGSNNLFDKLSEPLMSSVVISEEL